MEATKWKAVKVLKTNTTISEPNCIAYDEPLDAESLALFNSNGTYEKIFRVKKKDTSQPKQRLSVVKISHKDRVIYRQYAGRSIPISTDSIGLSPNSWQQLCLDNDSNKEVVVSEGCSFLFYWYHSNAAHRVSFRLGIVAIVFTVLCTIVSVVF